MDPESRPDGVETMQHAYQGVAEGLRLEIIGASRNSLPEIGRRLWQAVASGMIDDGEAESLDTLLRGRLGPPGGSRTSAVPIGGCRSLYPPKRRQRAPERTVMIERRRTTAASGWLPPAIAARFTVSEQAVLAVVVREIASRGACELAIDALAALAGCSRRLVQGALRLADETGLIRVEERRRQGQRNLPNRVTLLSRELVAWVTRRGKGGCKMLRPLSTGVQQKRGQRVTQPDFWLSEGRRRDRREPS